ncbi:MAG: LON peptidase substrate-binding domain-containing protein, partial [Wenzhouxiangellaceae bacterium]
MAESASEPATPEHESLPLFPLPLVLFPGAISRLRIFENRYLAMTRECSAKGTGFGIVHFQPAGENQPARHAAIGTEALIEDFTTLEDGLLGITVRGRRRFRIHSTRARDDGLILGQVEWIPAEPALPVDPEFAVLQAVLRELAGHDAFAELNRVESDDASALGMALASVLPLDVMHAQELLAVSDPNERLRVLGLLLSRDDDEDQDPEDADAFDP